MSTGVRGIRSTLRTGAPLPLRALAVAGGAVCAVSTIAFFRVSLLPPIGAEFDMSTAALSLITTVFAGARLLADLPAGRLADAAPPVRGFLIAACGVAAGSGLLAAAGSRGAVLVAAAVLGVGSAIGNTTGMTFFSSRAKAGRRGTSMAVFSAALLVGQALGPAFGGLISAAGSWRTAAVAGAGAGLLVALALLLGPALPGVPDGAGGVAPEGLPAPPPGAPTGPVERAALYGVSFVSFFTLGAMPQTLVPLIGADVFGLSITAIGLALALGGVCRLIGSLVGGVVSDRVSRKAALVPGLVVMAAGVALLAVESWSGAWLIAIVLLSLGSFGVSVAATILADRTHAAAVGRRFGTFRLIGDIGLMTGPLVTGLVYTHVGHVPAVLSVVALLLVCALASAAFVWDHTPATEPVAMSR